MIKTIGLTKTYGDLDAIRDVSFEVDKGAIVGFLGPNGAGKSTTMKILTGFMPATRGQAIVAGYDVFENPMAVKRRVGYLPESPPIYGDLTVHEYLTFVGKLKGLRGAALRSDIERVVNRVALAEHIDRLIRNLSKGYQQRTGFAQALLGNPEVLILDEPTSGMDPRQIREVRTIIKELAGDHTVLLSTHTLSEVTATCDRVIIISGGTIVADDTLKALADKHAGGNPEMLEKIFLSLTEA
jgi:ABC-2 type transport system ATP-binding protein